MAPAVLCVASIAIYPIVRIFWLSLVTQNLGTGLQPEFSGIANYMRVMSDGHFFDTLWFTALFTLIAVGIELLLGLAFATLLNRQFPGRGLARGATLVPWALPTAVLALAWTWIFNDQFGVFNDLLLRLHLIGKPVAWLGNAETARFAVIFADIWKTTPFMTIILLAGLQNIPGELYEAAAIDGSSAPNTFLRITLPMLAPSIMLAVLFRTLQSFGIFDLIYVMTGGGPGGSTETVAIYTYNSFFRYLDFGYGAALIVTTFVVMAVIAFVIYYPLSRIAADR
jgi:multiple sugar transport system permease protein